MDVLQLYRQVSLFAFGASLLAILSLRLLTDSTYRLIEKIAAFRSSLERASGHCIKAWPRVPVISRPDFSQCVST